MCFILFFYAWDFAVVRSRPNLLIRTVRNQNDDHSILMKSTLYSCGLCGLLPDYTGFTSTQHNPNCTLSVIYQTDDTLTSGLNWTYHFKVAPISPSTLFPLSQTQALFP